MAKRSQKRHLHHERGHSGCMGGLISIFDFRQGRSTRKLLSDKKHGSSRHAAGAGSSKSRLQLTDFEDKIQVNNDHDETKTSNAGNKTSVKKLMEEDMSSEEQTQKQIPGVVDEQVQSDSENGGYLGKNHKQTKKTCKVSCNIDTQDSKASGSLESQEPYGPNSFEQFSHLDLAALMEEFCNQIHYRQEIHLQRETAVDSCNVQETPKHVKHNQIDELDLQLVRKHSILQEKLSEAAEAFLNQKFVDRHQSKLFMDALDILNSNKELLVRLLKDSNSLLVKHIQDPQAPQSEKVEHTLLPDEELDISRQGEELECRKQVSRHNIHNIFRRIRSRSRSPSKGNESPPASNRIVVLKPNQMGNRSSVTAIDPCSSPHSLHSLNNQEPRRTNSQFSLGEIKRKLKPSMGENRKERHWIFMDGILHRIPTKRQSSGNDHKGIAREISQRELQTETHFDTGGTETPSVSGESEDKVSKPTHFHPNPGHEVASTSALSSRDLTMKRDGYPNHRVSNIYVEAKKHLAEMLSNADGDGDFSNLQAPRSLGRILSLPEYDFSPLFSPEKDRQHGFITAQMRFSPHDKFRIVNENMRWPKPDSNANHLSPSRQNREIKQSTTDNDNPEIKLQELDSNLDTTEELLPDAEIHKSNHSSEGDLSPEGRIVEVTDVALHEDNFFNDPAESDSIPIISTETAKISEEEEVPNYLEMDSPTNGQPPSAPFYSLSSSSLFIQKGEALESRINDAPDRPSPISVLEPMFSEDVNSPTSTISQSAEPPVQPHQLHFEEEDCSTVMVTPTCPENHSRTCTEHKNSIFGYVTSVLQASNLNLDELVEKLHSSEQLLDPSLFDEIEDFSGELCSDHKLIFDSTNEVLVEVCDRYFGCTPWVGFVNPNIRPAPVGEGIIQEVWEGINWHLLPQLLPRTLDQIIGKDMEKARMWMDFRFDTEGLGIEMAEVILDELMEDAILGLCS